MLLRVPKQSDHWPSEVSSQNTTAHPGLSKCRACESSPVLHNKMETAAFMICQVSG